MPQTTLYRLSYAGCIYPIILMVHYVVVMDEYLNMVKKDIGIAYLSEHMIEQGLKVRDHSHRATTKDEHHRKIRFQPL